MQLFALGLNHHTAPLAIREQVAFRPERLVQALATQGAVALENAMEEACDQMRTVVHPPLPGTVGVVAVAHRDLAGDGAACTVVLTLRGRVLGALCCLAPRPFDAAFVATAEAVAALLAVDAIEPRRPEIARFSPYAR